MAPVNATAPLLLILKSVVVANAAVEEETAKARLLVEDAVGVSATVSAAYGEVVPTPRPVLPLVSEVVKERFWLLVSVEPSKYVTPLVLPPVVVAVPPLASPSVPVTSVAKFTNAVDTTPAVALRKPERPLMVSEPTCAAWAKRLVEEAVVAKLFDEVALASVVLPVTASVPPTVVLPRLATPVVNAVENKLVLDAVVAKELVVVALVEVELSAVKFWSVVEPSVWKLVE